MFDDCSHRIEIVIMVIAFYLAFSADEKYQLHWYTVSGIALVCLIIDFAFFQKDLFIYDPDYNHWKDVTEREEFDIKQE